MATGDRKSSPSRTKVDHTPRSHKRVASYDIHKDAWTGTKQDPSTYLTTQQLATDLEQWASLYNGHVIVYPESMYRWCKQWFGDLPPGRTGPGMGYRIPLPYRYVARVWHQTQDSTIREAATKALLLDGENPKPWVITVANLGSTHYTGHEVASRVLSLLPTARKDNHMVHVLYVGDERKPDDG